MLMRSQSILGQTTLSGQLAATSQLNPEGALHQRSMAAELLLTALVDAFSILVIFLLMSFSSTGDLLMIGKGTELPKAALTELLERQPVVKVEEGQIFLENQPITGDGLVAGLLHLREEFQSSHQGQEYPGIVTLQADRRVKFDFLNQIVLACANAGFSDIRFAVLVK